MLVSITTNRNRILAVDFNSYNNITQRKCIKITERKLFEIQELLQANGGPIPMSKAGLYLAAKKGDIPTVKIGRRVFVPEWWVSEMTSKPRKADQAIEA